MSNSIRLSAALTLALGLALGACGPKKDTSPPDVVGPTACTEEAKVCDDGSSVAREGPDCEFAACPGDGDLPLDDAEPSDGAEEEAEPAAEESP